MAPRPLLALVLLAAAAAVCFLAARGDANSGQDCCLRVPSRPPPFSRKIQKQLTSYRIQGSHMGCQREAIVFITKRRRELCISPDADWAQELMWKIDAMNQKAERDRQGD